MKCGIYYIRNLKNNKLYIGKSVDITNRFKKHIENLSANRNENPKLQNSWNKHGKESFEFGILEECNTVNLDEREKYFINLYDSHNNGYNCTDGGSGSIGFKHTFESKNKVSIGNSGKKRSLEVKSKMSRARAGSKHPLFGKHHSKEAKEKISKTRIDRNIAKGKNNPNFGKFKKRNYSTSFYFGVRKVLDKNKYTYWRASIKINGKTISIGSSKSESGAAGLYNNYIIKNNLPNPLNIIEETT